ncbi:MAG: hypothetical protein ABJA66_11965 [Actinomycetota bacterium]
MKKILLCLILLLFSFLIVSASEKDKVMQVSRQIFGEPIDTRRNLFNINRFYVYRLDFDKQNRMSELAIEPKYYFSTSHPDWEETEDFKPLTFTAYKNLLGQLELVKTKGNLISKDQIDIVGNATAFHQDHYEHSLLETGFVFSLDADENTPTEIKYFRLNFRKDRNKKISVKPMTKKND